MSLFCVIDTCCNELHLVDQDGNFDVDGLSLALTQMPVCQTRCVLATNMKSRAEVRHI
jgi:hypothetical protein